MVQVVGPPLRSFGSTTSSIIPTTLLAKNLTVNIADCSCSPGEATISHLTQVNLQILYSEIIESWLVADLIHQQTPVPKKSSAKSRENGL